MSARATPNKALDDDLVMGLVEIALAQPAAERSAYLEQACGSDGELLEEVRKYVEWEERMDGFLLEPLFAPSALEHRLEPGELLAARFRIVCALDEGGMGVVYEAIDEKLDRRVAIKCAKSGFRKRLSPEVRNATEFNHPNICKIHEIHTASTAHGEVDFITMEFLEGETLAKRLQRGRLPEPEARSIARQLCAGLAEAHRHKVVHGDLKTNNVILARDPDGSERAVITDFGLARGPSATLSGGGAQSLGAAGAPDYMAPELWKGEKVSTASDVYALGVILCELAVGHRPFDREVPIEERITRRPPAIHPKWDRVLSRCLDQNPARRFQDAAEVAKTLNPPEKQRWWMTAAAGVLLAAVLGAITYARMNPPKEDLSLGLTPIQTSSPEISPLGEKLYRETRALLSVLRGGAVAKFEFVPLSPQKDSSTKTSHLLHVTLSRRGTGLLVQAALSDRRSGSSLQDWSAYYSNGQERYIPVALAGMVTASLKLPPLTTVTPINAGAVKDYWAGVYYLRRPSGYDAARTYLERAVAADPDSPLAFAGLAEARWRIFEATRTLDETKASSWLEGAKEAERQAELRNPDLPAVHRIAGVLLKTDGLYNLAEAEYRRAGELEPANSDTYILLGKVYEAMGRFDAALAAYREAVAKEPDYYRPYQDLSAYFYNRSRFTEAVPPYEKAVQLVGDDPGLRDGLAAIYNNLGWFEKAADQYRISIQQQPTASAWHRLGITQMYLAKNAEAINSFKNALKLTSSGNTTRYQTLMYLGIAYKIAKQDKLATEANIEGLRLAGIDWARNPSDGYREAFVAFFDASLGNARAKSEIDAAVHLSSDSDTLWTAVLTYEELGLRDKTVELLAKSPHEQLEDLNRFPPLKSLSEDHQFQQLLTSHVVE